MGDDIDDFIQTSTLHLPQAETPTQVNNDPLFSYIKNFLRDPTATTFDIRSFNNTDGVNRNTSHATLSPSIDLYQPSKTVYPVYTIPITNENQILSEEQVTHTKPITQFDCSQFVKIKIITHPRIKFRPRTEKESKESSHFLRCEDNIAPAYPTIYIPQIWAKEDNFIQVTLVGIDKQPHPYTIDNKECNISPLILKLNESHSLYFHVTKEDYDNGEKSFLIEYIKSKQDDVITKQLIQTRQLYQSMLRFTRFYLTADGSYQPDEASIEYSSIMTEHYGDFTIEDIFPLYGPLCGNQKVCIELKGPITKNFKTDLTITITCNEINWSYQVDNIRKSGSNLTFLMPSFPHPNMNRAKVSIIIEYKQDIIHQSNYIYTKKLDEELVENNWNQSNSMVAVGSSLSNNCGKIPGAFPIWSSTETTCENHGAKRLKK
ncbi:unnamed protein product [Rotaria sordida]|uniref:Uncharacterized protein n=1 Tax=Rotaria sordida TaxID=392033 RepID=A0A814CKS3_9BILA|nr:unnamed protein product [Rotaria sordida]